MLINRYKATPLHKALLKDALFLARFIALYFYNRGRVRTVLFYPEFSLFSTSINRYLMRSRFNVTNNPKHHFDLVVAWQDATFRDAQPLLDELSRDYTVVNHACTNISKTRVEAVSREVFGYGLQIDPRRYRGRCVCKSNHNGQHDSIEIVQCPVSAVDERCVYQRLVDNSLGPNHRYDLRMMVCGDRISAVCLRYRHKHTPFEHDLCEEVYAPETLMSGHEISQVLRLARRMGLDFGEIDAVRDACDGRLHVVDVNNTPQITAPRERMLRSHWQRYLQRGGTALANAFLKPAIRKRADAAARA